MLSDQAGPKVQTGVVSMSVKLNRDDFQRVVRIVATSPDFESIDGRIALVRAALEGVPRGEDVRVQLNLNGAAQTVAINVVSRLADFGRVSADKEALGVFLNYLLHLSGDFDEDGQFLRYVIGRYEMDRPIIGNSPIANWLGRETNDSVQEKIIGENTLRDIFILHQALTAARSVVHVSLPSGYGTGFIVGQNLLMTNHHVISDLEVAERSAFSFHYELDANGIARLPIVVHAAKNGMFYSNQALDFTILEIESKPDESVPLVLKPERQQLDTRVSIIQHPGGHYKKISMQNNFVAYADATVLQYTTSTMPGSSGSPIFNDVFEVIGIHHSGGRMLEPGTDQFYRRNAGTSMNAILGDLRQHAPEVLASISTA